MSLKEIIYGKRRERIYTDGTTLGGVICPLIKMHKWNLYIYGAGKHIEAIVSYLWGLDIEVQGIFDCDDRKEGKMILDKVPVIRLDKDKRYDTQNTFVLINTSYFKGIEQYEIVKALAESGVTKFYEINPIEKNEVLAKPHAWADVGRITYYREHYEELKAIYEELWDEKSKAILQEFVRVYMQYGTYSLKQCDSNLKYFYGQNEDGTQEQLYNHLKDEVWINCGSNNGDNIFWYFANGLQAKAIYAYEADGEIYDRLLKNLDYLPEVYRKVVQPVNEFLDSKTMWDDKVGAVTLINADIEGGELGLLKSMKDIIETDRPVIALAAYHKAADLIELPQTIKEVVDSYCFVLRKYECNVENARRAAELVLYAIPRERINCQLSR